MTSQGQDALAPTRDYPVRLTVFEGPLDLLLYLIRRNEIDIYDIPIETVTRQYLEVLGAMEGPDLESAGEFFVMASTLMYIKSRMLLPRQERAELSADEDEEADPRWELVQQLIEYKRFKEAAATLDRLILSRRDLIPRESTLEPAAAAERPLAPVDRIDLWNTFNRVLRRLAERVQEGSIHAEQVTVADRMEAIIELLATRKRFNFSSLFAESTSVTMIVASFLAVLELARLNRLRLEQSAAFADIECIATE